MNWLERLLEKIGDMIVPDSLLYFQYSPVKHGEKVQCCTYGKRAFPGLYRVTRCEVVDPDVLPVEYAVYGKRI